MKAEDGVLYWPAFHVCHCKRAIPVTNQICWCEADLITFQQLHRATCFLPNVPGIHAYTSTRNSFQDSDGAILQDALARVSIVVGDAFQPEHQFDEEGLVITIGRRNELILLGKK